MALGLSQSLPLPLNVLGLSESAEDLTKPEWLATIFGWMRNKEPRLFIDNEWVTPYSGQTVETSDPSTGTAVGSYAIADATDIDIAVSSGVRAQTNWAKLTLDQRSEYLLRLRELVAENSNLLATLDAINAGLPIRTMRVDTNKVAQQLLAWPKLAASLAGDVLHNGTPGLHYTRYAPYGVIARIVAYNHPLLFAMKAIAPAVLAGNSVVLKAAEQAPFSALLLAELIREVFPPGVVNIVTGDACTGNALVTHPQIRRVAFTGSVRTGQLIQQAAAKDQIRNVSLELGGKNAMIVFPDVEIKDVVQDAIFGMNFRANSGQSCGSTSRLLVHRDIYEELVKQLAAAMSTLQLGTAYGRDTEMGPLISASAASRVRDHIASGVEQGARLVSGGLDDPRVPKEGHFVAPTLFCDVPPTARIAMEEIFGPVIAVAPWDDYESMLAVANGLDYGLTASIWTNDLKTALKTAHRMEVGYVWVNDSTTHYFGTPFGGWKNSGVGREECLEEYKSYLQVQSIHVKLG